MRRFQKPIGRVLPFLFPFLLDLLLLSNAWGMHKGIHCSSCHTQMAEHINGRSYGDHGLSKSMICLSCHDATQDISGLNPPHVFNGHVELAGGSFTPTLHSDETGHNIQSPDMILGLTPPGGASMTEFGCLSCHDPHNNGNYRSLKKEINGHLTPVQALGDPVYQENLYISGMNEFCGACHDNYYRKSNTRGMRGWMGHPVGITIHGARHADFEEWSSKETRVTLVENPSGDSNDLHNAQVFCLTCHRAHASAFDDAMRWDYRHSKGGCLDCHNLQ